MALSLPFATAHRAVSGVVLVGKINGHRTRKQSYSTTARCYFRSPRSTAPGPVAEAVHWPAIEVRMFLAHPPCLSRAYRGGQGTRLPAP